MRSREFPTLVALLRDRAKNTPDRPIYTFLKDGEIPSNPLTHQQLDGRARAIAAQLQTFTKPGDRALAIYPFTASLDFVQAFWGCLYAGVIAVTDNPPHNRQTLLKVQQRLQDSQARVILTTRAFHDRLLNQLPPLPELVATFQSFIWVITDEILPETQKNWQSPPLHTDSIAFLQYTSGSTGNPKGAIITHGNVLSNCAAIEQAFQITPEARGLVWLPLFHDMGLIGGVVQPLYSQFPVFLMSPLSFIQKPFRWLQAISRHRITVSGGPNFTYDLLCEKVTPAQKEILDLRSWQTAFIGAEPIQASTLNRFSETFTDCGFSPHAFLPCYGMAETTLMISGGKRQTLPQILHIDSTILNKSCLVLQKPTNSSLTNRDFSPPIKTAVSCGFVGLEMTVKIVNPQQQSECSEGEIGEIWVAGKSVSLGYWQQKEATQQLFQAYLQDSQAGPFLRTGDLGFLYQEELFITGRIKDTIILWGRNHYPHQIEATVVQSHPALQRNSGAAFSVEIDNQEKLAIAQEIQRQYLKTLDPETVVKAIRQAVMTQHLAEIELIILLKPGSLPKTTSGKIQRQLCKTKYLNCEFEPWYFWQSQTTLGSDLNLLELPAE